MSFLGWWKNGSDRTDTADWSVKWVGKNKLLIIVGDDDVERGDRITVNVHLDSGSIYPPDGSADVDYEKDTSLHGSQDIYEETVDRR